MGTWQRRGDLGARLKIAFLYDDTALGSHRAPIDYFCPDDRASGLTGTDLVAVYPARELAMRGHDVTVFSARSIEAKVSLPGGTLCVKPFARWAKDSGDGWDAAIAIGSPNALAYAKPGTLRLVNRQCSTFGCDSEKGFDKFVDLYMCPSETAAGVVAKGTKEHGKLDPSKFRVLPNGCYPEHFEGIAKVPGRCVYTSSPDRGLHLLLAAWPKIRDKVPHATLRIFYYSLHEWLSSHADASRGFGNPVDEECHRRAVFIRHALAKLTKHGIEVLGGVTHRQLEQEIGQAEALTFPTDCLAFTETFSVATLEACAAGAVPCISTDDSLGQIYGEVAPAIKHPVRDRIGDYADLVVRSLTDKAFVAEVAAKTKPFAAEHAWPKLAAKLEEIIVDGRAKLELTAPVRVVTASTSCERPTICVVLTGFGSGGRLIDIDRIGPDDFGGGCRMGFMGLVRALPALGYKVCALSTFANPGVRGDISFESIPANVRDYQGLSGAIGDPDILVAYYDTTPLVGANGCLRVASHHTYNPPCVAGFESSDINVAPSVHSRDALRVVFGGHEWHVMPNAVDPSTLRRAPVPGRVIHHVSPSRGLATLLVVWPSIRKSLPHATLHIVGDVDGWRSIYRNEGSLQGDRARLVDRALVGAMAAGGVKMLGPLSRADLESELAEAEVFAFPCDPPMPCETFSVATLEACEAGVPVVLLPSDALGSVYKNVALMARDATDFGDCLLRALTDPRLRTSLVNDGAKFAARHTFANKAKALDFAIHSHWALHDAVVARTTRPARTVRSVSKTYDSPHP